MSWMLGMAIVGAVGLGVPWLLRFVRGRWLKVVFALFAPVLAAAALYWGLVALAGATSDPEFAVWSGFFIVTWAAAGYVAMGLGALVQLLVRAIRKRG